MLILLSGAMPECLGEVATGVSGTANRVTSAVLLSHARGHLSGRWSGWPNWAAFAIFVFLHANSPKPEIGAS